MRNTVVVHFADGRLLKGITNNFFPNKDRFHLADRDTGEVCEIPLRGLKAVFFVKDFEGNPDYQDRQDVQRSGLGKRLRVDFVDGETLIGYSQGYTAGRQGFFVFPADPDSNIDRVYVLTESTRSVCFVQPGDSLPGPAARPEVRPNVPQPKNQA